MPTTDAELTDAQWQIADAIARQLVLDGVDVNELRKAIAYLRTIVETENAGKRFFDYLKTLVRHGNSIGHSERTVEYYRSLDNICSERLTGYQNDAPKMLSFLCWAARLVKYYKEGVPTGELTIPEIKTEREERVKAITAANSFEVGQLLDATIIAIQKGKITYEMLSGLKQSPKEIKLLKNCTLAVGQNVKVEIIGLKEDGSIRKVKGQCPDGCEKKV